MEESITVQACRAMDMATIFKGPIFPLFQTCSRSVQIPALSSSFFFLKQFICDSVPSCYESSFICAKKKKPIPLSSSLIGTTLESFIISSSWYTPLQFNCIEFLLQVLTMQMMGFSKEEAPAVRPFGGRMSQPRESSMPLSCLLSLTVACINLLGANSIL